MFMELTMSLLARLENFNFQQISIFFTLLLLYK